jgi:SNF2 family DNA or RNA helicase
MLHFLHPTKFTDLGGFLDQYGVIEDAGKLASLQQLIKPFLLLRRKADVDTTIPAKEETIIGVELARIHKTYCRAFLHENAGILLQQITGGVLPSLLNLMMQLRKVYVITRFCSNASRSKLKRMWKARKMGSRSRRSSNHLVK